MMEMWSSFSKSDNPYNVRANFTWTNFEKPRWEYLKIEDEEYETGQDLRERVCLFWDRSEDCFKIISIVLEIFNIFRIVPQFLPQKPDRLSRRSGGFQEMSCKNVKQSKIYFPGYRSIVRLN